MVLLQTMPAAAADLRSAKLQTPRVCIAKLSSAPVPVHAAKDQMNFAINRVAVLRTMPAADADLQTANMPTLPDYFAMKMQTYAASMAFV
jgi:hypothetical protein